MTMCRAQCGQAPDLGGIEAVEPQVRLNHAERKTRT
jgi:hypothetical protein